MPEHRPDEAREIKRSSFPDAGDNFRLLTGPEAVTLRREWLMMDAIQCFRWFGYWPGERV